MVHAGNFWQFFKQFFRCFLFGCFSFVVVKFRSFEKGLADRGGWREDILRIPEIQASFLYPFAYAPLGEG